MGKLKFIQVQKNNIEDKNQLHTLKVKNHSLKIILFMKNKKPTNLVGFFDYCKQIMAKQKISKITKYSKYNKNKNLFFGLNFENIFVNNCFIYNYKY